MHPARLPDFVSTGIAGLDDILRGGFVRGSSYLIQGDPGSGKTTLALQFAREQTRRGHRCLYLSLTETRADLESACRSHGWSLDGIDICDLTQASDELQSQGSVFHPADTELLDLSKRLVDELERAAPEYVIFDGLAELRLLAIDPLRYRRTLLSFKALFEKRGVTTVLLDDRTASFQNVQPESLLGGNVVLERHMPLYGRSRRRVYVTKVRGAHFREGFHDYEIVTGGMLVHPRLVAGEHHQREYTQEIYPSGLQNLDTMLQGGLTSGSTTLLLGPAGAGKSTTAMQFVVHALESGKKAAVYIFDEVMHTLLERSEKLCLKKPGGIRAFIDEGRLHVQQIDPAEMSPGAFAHEVRRALEAGATTIVIDSLNGYLNAMPEERFLTTHLHELFAFLNQQGILTIIVVAQHGMGASSSPTNEVDVSYLADTVLLFRYYEAGGEVKQALSVFKKRTGPHDRTIRELTIDTSGFSVGEPLRQFRGILTGVPQYVPPVLGGVGAAPEGE
ncbi:MAG TPA: ATPase domain-containing protein [Polyangiaceae bacterium]|jgi:circadian clock protein KaiC|nr:ATPase domain-containing protein [Polyangiaceae bacterium]